MPHFYGRDEGIFTRKNSVLFKFWGRIMIFASFLPGKQVLRSNYASFTGGIRPKLSYRNILCNFGILLFLVNFTFS